MPVIKQDTDNLLTNFGFHLQSFVHGQNVLDPQQLANTIDSRLSEDLATIVYSLHCLEAANKIFDIHLLVVTDDFTKANLTAILWARMQGIKSLRLGHGVPLCEEYTILASRVTDYMTVFGQRCLEEYADIGVDISKVVITGHPMWDQYTRLRMQKSHCRAQVCQKYGLRADIPIVVFATTYTAYLTAHSCPSIHADTARDFFIACRALREKNIVFNIVIKDRLGWQREYPQAQGDKVLETLLLDILGEEAQEHYRYVLSNRIQLFLLSSFPSLKFISSKRASKASFVVSGTTVSCERRARKPVGVDLFERAKEKKRREEVEVEVEFFFTCRFHRWMTKKVENKKRTSWRQNYIELRI